MIRKLLAVAAVMVGIIGVAPMAVAVAAPAAPAAPSVSIGPRCGYLEGAGGNSSLFPREIPAAGESFVQITSGAWRLCYRPASNDDLTLYAYNGTWCMADDSGKAELQHCADHNDQAWIFACNQGICLVSNANGGVLCSGGSEFTADTVPASSACSSGDQEWIFQSST